MSKIQQRSNDYYRQRLKNEHPTIYADLVSGRYTSLHQALLAAGLKTKRTRFVELKNAWHKADPSEQTAFIQFLTAQGILAAGTAFVATSTSPASTAVARDRRLLPAVKARIKEISDKRGLEPGDVMRELGQSPHDQSIRRAMAWDTRLRVSLLNSLAVWLDTNKHI